MIQSSWTTMEAPQCNIAPRHRVASQRSSQRVDCQEHRRLQGRSRRCWSRGVVAGVHQDCGGAKLAARISRKPISDRRICCIRCAGRRGLPELPSLLEHDWRVYDHPDDISSGSSLPHNNHPAFLPSRRSLPKPEHRYGPPRPLAY
jgi:hypothetical protein